MPDANTLWDFREALIRAGALDELFGPARPRDHGRGPSAARWPDPGRYLGGGSPPAADRRREGPDQGGTERRRDLAREAGQGASEGRRRALDAAALQAQGAARRGRDDSPRGPAFRPHVARLDRPHAWADPPPARDLCRPARRGPPARGADPEGPHRPRCLGRQRLPLGRERGLAHRPGDGQPHPPQKAPRPADAPTHPPRPAPAARRSARASSTSSPSRRRA